MRAINLSDLETRLDPKQAQRVKREFITHLLNQKGAWLDRELKRILPPDIYKMGHDHRGIEDEDIRPMTPAFKEYVHRQEKLKKWLDSHDIRLEEQGLNARLFRGKEKIGSFFVKLAEK
jgi:hypothetical protein